MCALSFPIYFLAACVGIMLLLRFLRLRPVLMGYQLLYLAVGLGAFFTFKYISRVESGTLKNLLMGLLAGGIVYFVLGMGRKYSEARLQAWGQEQHYKILDSRGALIWEGPKAWLRSKYQHAYRLTVRDEQGRERWGWILFGDAWGMNPDKAEWQFDND